MDENTRAEFLGIVEEETDRLTRIINQLLDISRIEAGRIKLELRNFSLLDVVRRSIETMKEQAKSNDIAIYSDLQNDLPYVFADQDKTAQVILNLLSNAVKYNKKGGQVQVRLKDAGDKVTVEVEDTGPGISPNDLPHMFEKFYRVDTTSDMAPGTGLGLAVSKSLVEVMGGGVNVESQLGKGSKFTFYLPKGAAD